MTYLQPSLRNILIYLLITYYYHHCFLVPSAPRRLQLRLVEDDPPVVYMSWQAPVVMHGTLTGYQLIYGVSGEEIAEQRQFDADRHQYTTTFLGNCDYFSILSD